MARIITVASQKGGVGKTTTALNLGFSLSRLGQRVLVVDTDPQGGMAIASNLSRRTSLGLVQIIRRTASPKDVMAYTRDRQMAAIGTGLSDPDEVVFFEDAARNGALGAKVLVLSAGFDYAILDAPAGVGSIVQALLHVSDGVVLVVRCQNILLKSLPVFLRLVKRVRKTRNPKLRMDGVVVTMFDERDPIETQFCEEFIGSLPESVFLKTRIRYDPVFERASVKAVPVAMMPGADAAARSYLDLALELRERDMRRMAEGGTYGPTEGLF